MSMSRPRASTPTSARKVTKKKAAKKKATKKPTEKRKIIKPKATKTKKAAKKKVTIPDEMKFVPGLRCVDCWDVLYSRHTTDHRRCNCGRLSISGPPESPHVTAGAGKPVRLNITVSRKAMLSDHSQGYNAYGRVRFPNSTFRYIASRLFPVQFGSSARRDGRVNRIEGTLSLIQPRSTPEGAPVCRNMNGDALLWADNKDVWGKVEYKIRDATVGKPISTTSALVKLIPLELLVSLTYDTKLRAFGSGWRDLLHRYARDNPEWFLNPPPVKDFIFMDVLSHSSASTPRGYERALEGKRRMGKLFPSIMGR